MSKTFFVLPSICFCLLLVAWTPVLAEESAEVWKNLLSSFDITWQEPPDSFWEALQKHVNMNLSLGWPLKGYIQDAGRDSSTVSSPTAQASIKYTDFGYWFARVNFLHYWEDDRQASWDPDFTYSFGYDDWHPYTLSFIYDNYAANNYHPDRSRGEKITPFREGTYHLRWKFLVPEVLSRPFLLEPKKKVPCQIGYNLTPDYSDNQGRKRKNKRTVSLGCSLPIYAGLKLSLTLLHYPDINQQQPWNPDYTYEIQYSDPSLGGFSISYKNYAGNRYPWRREYPNNGGFSSGSIHIGWSGLW